MNKTRRFTSFSDLSSLASSPPDQSSSKTEGMLDDPLMRFVTLRIQFEKSGRKGAGVTVIRGFHHADEDLRTLARELKTLCGSGGTVKADCIEIQGDHRVKIATHLKKLGFTVKGV